MNYLVAVSGGVDSVVLLDMLSKTDHRLVVAHVDHGIRGEESAADVRFVREVAKKYGLPFVMTELKLGERASEERARALRYEFLFAKAEELGATVVTAHHLDDLVETVALNLERGTGWRGLAVLNRQGITRPLLPFPKSKLYEYALAHHLEWVEDATNHSDVYQRNRIRARIARSSIDREKIMSLRGRQLQLGRDIERETERLIRYHAGERHFYTQIDETVAIEVLGAEIVAAGATRPTRPQLIRALHAIKTAKPRATHHVAKGIELYFTSRKFEVKVV